MTSSSNAAFVVHNGNGYRFVFRDPSLEAATDPTDNTGFHWHARVSDVQLTMKRRAILAIWVAVLATPVVFLAIGLLAHLMRP